MYMERSLQAFEHTLLVYRGTDFAVKSGANLGDTLSIAIEMSEGDCYELHADADVDGLSIGFSVDGQQHVTRSSLCGAPMARLVQDCSLVFMSDSGHCVNASVWVELDDTQHIAEVYVSPERHMPPLTPFTLIKIAPCTKL